MGTVWGIAGILIFLSAAYLAGRVAHSKGRPFWVYLVAGLVVGPIALIIALLVPRRRPSV